MTFLGIILALVTGLSFLALQEAMATEQIESTLPDGPDMERVEAFALKVNRRIINNEI